MKYVSRISVVLLAIIALAACSKKGSNNAANNGLIGGGCVMGANGLCSNGTPYFGAGGQWSGALTVSNPALFQQFSIAQGAGGVGMIQQYIGLSVKVTQGSGRFKLSRSYYGRWIPMLQKQGQVYSNSVNGFNIVSQNYYFNGGGAYQTAVPTILPASNGFVAPGMNTSIQVVVTFVDATQRIANVQLIYANQLMAQGQMSGNPYYGINGGVAYNGGYTYQSTAPAILPAR